MAQATYRQIPDLLSRLRPFEGNSMRAEWESGVYRVYSYNTCIAEWWPELDGGTYIENDTSYSVTSARHQGTLWALTRTLGDVHHVVYSDVYRGTQRLHSDKHARV